MKLIFFRHGIAFPCTDPSCPPDPERPLIEQGIRRTRAAARGLRALSVAPGAILTSPYRRCLETATIAARELDFPVERIVQTPSLLFQSPPDQLRVEAAAVEANTVLLVGHRPHLDYAIADLLGLHRPVTSLKKAGAAAVAVTSTGVVSLEWVMTPGGLRLLGSFQKSF